MLNKIIDIRNNIKDIIILNSNINIVKIFNFNTKKVFK